MVSEPLLDNEIYPPYNVTKNFATYHSSGSIVVKSLSNLSSIKAVASKKDRQYITIINSGENASIKLKIIKNASSSFKDLETGEIYTLNNGNIDIGKIEKYGIRYLESYNIQTESEIPPSEGDGGGGSLAAGYQNNSHFGASNLSINISEETLKDTPSQKTNASSSCQEQSEETDKTLTGKAISEDEEKIFTFWKVALILLVFVLILLIVYVLYTIYSFIGPKNEKVCQFSSTKKTN